MREFKLTFTVTEKNLRSLLFIGVLGGSSSAISPGVGDSPFRFLISARSRQIQGTCGLVNKRHRVHFQDTDHDSSTKMWQQLSGTPNWEDVSLVCQTPPPNCRHGSTSSALLCRVASPALLLLPASAGISGVHCSLIGPRRRKS